MNENSIKKVQDVPEGSVLFDVLSATSFASTHIKGAENFCVYEVAFLDKVQEMYPDKDQAICLYGWSDKSEEAFRAYFLLANAGYTNLTILEGGLEKWENDGRSVEIGETIDQLNGVYEIDRDRCHVEWIGRNIGNKHYGTIDIKKGSFIYEDNELISGEIIFDMTRIENIDLDEAYKQHLINHLKSDDFFSVEEYPEARLTIVSVEKIRSVGSAANYHITADLMIKDHTHQIAFNAFAHYKEDDMVMNAHFDIDRTQWDVKYGSEHFFSRMGIHVIDDIISFDLIIFAAKK
jgi:polyisoprenoid-binding protein YceI